MNSSKEPVLEAYFVHNICCSFLDGLFYRCSRTAQSRIRGSRFISIVVLSLLLKETVLAWGCSARSVKKRIGNSRSSSHGRKSKASPEGKKRPQAQTLSTSAVITGSFHLFWLLQNLKIKIQPSVCISVWVHHHRRVFQTVLCSLPYSLSPHLSYRALHLVMCMWVLEHDKGKMNEITDEWNNRWICYSQK